MRGTGLAAAALFTQILTSQFDNARTGANLTERTLKPANVNVKQFGKLFVYPVDGDVYAQPLYMADLDLPGIGKRNVLFVATEADSVYAFDASGEATKPLWHRSFTKPGGGTTAIPATILGCPFIEPDVGITSTPVIDLETQMLYTLARTRELDSGGTARLWQRLHALDIRTGAEKFGGPVAIKASIPGPKTWFGLVQDQLDFSPSRENPRAALSLYKGTVFLTWASSCDIGPYHGWVMTYSARTLKQTGVYNTSPEASQSGIWQSDTGPAMDDDGNFYAITGNGLFDGNRPGGRDFGDSVLKLASTSKGIVLRDWFTPFNEQELDRGDGDLGSGGPIVLPDQAGAHKHILVASGKGDAIYVIDRDHMGGFHQGSNIQIIQTLHEAGTGSLGAPAYWNSHLFYLCRGDVLKDFAIENGRLNLCRTADRSGTFSEPGATPVISASGNKDGIVWAVESHGFSPGSAILHAYEASDIAHELYNSSQNLTRDYAGRALRFVIPAIADGRVYVGAKGEVDVYGLLSVTQAAGPPSFRLRKGSRAQTSRPINSR